MTTHGWALLRMDVETAFLQGDRYPEVYMERPERYVDPTNPDQLCGILQALYGLRKAPKMWYAELDAFLKSQGFDNINPDARLYLREDDGDVIIILVYIDDLLVALSQNAIYKLRTALRVCFEKKDLGEAKVTLGLEISWEKTLGTRKLSQRQCATQVLVKF